MRERDKVLQVLDALGISYELQEHEAVHTIEDMERLGVFTAGEICKNLFLRNANGKTHYVVSMRKDKHPDIQGVIRAQLGCSRLSFGSDARLQAQLGLQPGAVSPFGIVNDDDHDVVIVLDRDLKTTTGLIGFHPNENTAFLWLRFADLMKFLHHFGNDVYFIDC